MCLLQWKDTRRRALRGAVVRLCNAIHRFQKRTVLDPTVCRLRGVPSTATQLATSWLFHHLHRRIIVILIGGMFHRWLSGSSGMGKTRYNTNVLAVAMQRLGHASLR